MPQVTDPRLTATARLLAALNQQPLQQIEQRRPPVIINAGQPQRSLGLLQTPVEQIRTPLPQVQGGLLQAGGGGQALAQPDTAELIEQAVGLAGKLGVNALASKGLETGLGKLGLSSIGDAFVSSLTGGAGFGFGGGISGLGFNVGTLGSIGAQAAPVVAPIGPLAGFALPFAAAAIPLAFSALRKLQGSPPSTTSIIGFGERGRPAVTDADAKGDLTSTDAEMLGRQAIVQLDKIRRELGGTFNKDIGDFAVLGSSERGFNVFDKGRLARRLNPDGVNARFKDSKDAFKAFSLIALREGAINAPQDKINKKIEELSEVFNRSSTVTGFGIPDSLGGPDFTPPTPQQEFESLTPFNQALINAQRTERLAEIFQPGFEFRELPFLAPTPDMTPAQRASFFAPRFQGGDFSDRADFVAGLGQAASPPDNFDFLLGLNPQLSPGVLATPERLAGMDSFGNPIKKPRSAGQFASFETVK